MSNSNSSKAAMLGVAFATLLAAGVGLLVSDAPFPRVFVLAAGSASMSVAWNINDLSVPLADRLRELPGVERVDVSIAVANPTHRIVHLLNTHYVGRGDYAIDLRDLSDEPISDEEMDRLYAEFLAEIVELQDSQREFLTQLVNHHGLEAVYMEGWTVQDAELFRVIAEMLWRTEHPPPGVGSASLNREDDPLAARRLEFGVPARLWATDTLQAILPAEDSELLEAANPIDENGQYREVDESVLEAREDFMVHEMLKRGRVSVIVLGGGHDLGDNVRRIAAKGCEYFRLTIANGDTVE